MATEQFAAVSLDDVKPDLPSLPAKIERESERKASSPVSPVVDEAQTVSISIDSFDGTNNEGNAPPIAQQQQQETQPHQQEPPIHMIPVSEYHSARNSTRNSLSLPPNPHVPPPVTIPLRHSVSGISSIAESTAPSSRPETPWGSSDVLQKLVEAPQVGTPTTTVHVAFSSKLGWMTWKDREASLFGIFERAFGCVKAEIKFTDALDQFGVDFEVPNDQVASLEKELSKKFILAEIDKIHGLSPATRTPDTRLLRITKSLGNTVCTGGTRSSIASLQQRVNNLSMCSKARRREADAIMEQWSSMKGLMEGKARKAEDKINAKPPKLVEVETWVVDRVMAELKAIQEW
ncbi:UNVERIFIED_CONTAM: hypothetical protein HDU68_000661 [Siphonaria sp. JEL0065]|nr:hypothetical protein HDU68_000661 [Siphonaria sp. JEL0065]